MLGCCYETTVMPDGIWCSTKFGFSIMFLTVALVVSVGRAKQSPRSPEGGEIERGRYLVEEVAKCAECHTPRNAQGELDRHAWLEGAPIWIMPVKAVPNWADRAPALAGFPGLTEEQGERVLEKGTGLRARRSGRPCTSTT